jgi:hypothetical protein
MGPGLFGDLINVILSGMLTLPPGKLSRLSQFVGAPYTTAFFIWMNSHRSAPQGAAGHDNFSVFCGGLRRLTVFIHLKTGIRLNSVR